MFKRPNHTGWCRQGRTGQQLAVTAPVIVATVVVMVVAVVVVVVVIAIVVVVPLLVSDGVLVPVVVVIVVVVPLVVIQELTAWCNSTAPDALESSGATVHREYIADSNSQHGVHLRTPIAFYRHSIGMHSICMPQLCAAKGVIALRYANQPSMDNWHGSHTLMPTFGMQCEGRHTHHCLAVCGRPPGASCCHHRGACRCCRPCGYTRRR